MELLRRRLEALPALMRECAAQPDPDLSRGPARYRRVWVTGVGNSVAHARFLADVLDRELEVPARFVATGALCNDRNDHQGDALVVFSQGLSPNAHYALHTPERWASLTLITATPDSGGDRPDRRDKASLLASLRAAGAVIHLLPGEEEYGTLVRVTGPMLAYAGALAVARSFARLGGRDVDALCLDPASIEAAWRRTDARVARIFPERNALCFERGLTLLCSGGYGERAQGWRHKVLEGMGLPWPPLWDLLEFSHGPFQQHAERACELIVLARADAPEEAELLDACARMFAEGPGHLRILRADLPGALAVFEHEAQGNALLVRWLEERRSDPRRWAGQDRDAPLYGRRPSPPSD